MVILRCLGAPGYFHIEQRIGLHEKDLLQRHADRILYGKYLLFYSIAVALTPSISLYRLATFAAL